MSSEPPSTQTELEAYAFRQLLAHLRARPDVANIDQMNLAGFCRNCLGKWYLRGAREKGLRMTYDEALEQVYGEPYGDWKGKHQKKATAEQLELFEQNAHLHAKHPKPDEPPKDVAPKESESMQPTKTPQVNAPTQTPVPPGNSALSDVCCTPADEIGTDTNDGGPSSTPARGELNHESNKKRSEKNTQSIPTSVDHSTQIRLGVLTVSDRAFAGVYDDLSGPAITQTVSSHFTNIFSTLSYVVPDDEQLIKQKIKQLVASGCNLVFTTGGTGIDPKDVTPEATLSVLHRIIPGISQYLLTKSLGVNINQPHMCLSRAVAGVRDDCLIINLPGRPSACVELVTEVAPILPHALRQIKGE